MTRERSNSEQNVADSTTEAVSFQCEGISLQFLLYCIQQHNLHL